MGLLFLYLLFLFAKESHIQCRIEITLIKNLFYYNPTMGLIFNLTYNKVLNRLKPPCE